ncbi:uncharacterized protein LOC111597115 isoform X3 [Drosophila hydei]|uniref:Uncharacterized protein LOC111597115 isoform X3 n=1 Tax=Drosophila hydei TaxID=7224 RepID=A0A6J1LUB6_DROHY|nr:uncharacterized protein LOC111597115 isoform X3 [Drosophila hydei]
MDDIEIEYLDEYKDLVVPGIKTTSDGHMQQTLMRMPLNRRTSSDSSGSSSIDPDIFQKLFDGKFLDDELLTETAKGSARRRVSSSSSESNDALDALYNRQSSKLKGTRRDRLESYDSIDDLGDALMGATRNSLSKPTSFQAAARKSLSHNGMDRSKSAKSAAKCNNPESFKPGTRPSGRSSSSSSSNPPILHKKAVTIIKAKKPDLNPPKHEPKEDPLHLQDFSDNTDTDSSYEYESDFYGYGDSDDVDASKHIIDISTDSSTVSSFADTVTPVVSEDESLKQQQQQQQTPHGHNDRLQLYLNNLSSAETPPSKQKYTGPAKKSRTQKKKQSNALAEKVQDQDQIDQVNAKAEKKFDSPSNSKTASNYCNEIDKESPADYVDVNLTYETLELLSLNLAEEIINIDAERSKEFESRSASKTRSLSSTKKVDHPTVSSSFSKSHVRKLTYSNEKLDEIATPLNSLRRAKSDGAFPKCGSSRYSKNRAATTESQITSRPPSPAKKIVETAIEQEPKMEIEVKKEPEQIKRKRGRPRKKKNKNNLNNFLSEQANPHPSKNQNATVKVEEKMKITTNDSNKQEEASLSAPSDTISELKSSNEAPDESQQELKMNDQETTKATDIAQPQLRDTNVNIISTSTEDSKLEVKAAQRAADNETDNLKLSAGKSMDIDGVELLNNAQGCENGECIKQEMPNTNTNKIEPEKEEKDITNQDSRDELEKMDVTNTLATDISQPVEAEGIQTIEQETDRRDEDLLNEKMEKIEKYLSEVMSPQEDIKEVNKEVTADVTDNQQAANPNVEMAKKKYRSLATIVSSPEITSATKTTKSESRNAKRLLRGDIDSVGIAETQRRNSPRLTEKSPVTKAPKVKREKTKVPSAPKTPRKSKASNVESSSHVESVKERPLRSSKSTTATTDENKKSEKPNKSAKIIQNSDDKDSATTHRKSRSTKPKSKAEQIDKSNLATITESGQSASFAPKRDANETNTSDVKLNSGKDIDIPTSSDTHKKVDAKNIEPLREITLTKEMSDLELLKTLDLNENSSCSEQQPTVSDTPPIKAADTTEDQKHLHEVLDLQIEGGNKEENTSEQSALVKQRAGMPREIRGLLQETGTEWELETAGNRGRATRSRVSTPIPGKSKKSRLKEIKSTDTPTYEQINDKPEAKPDQSPSCSELSIKDQENESLNINKNQTNENIEEAAALKADSADQSDHQTMCCDIRHSDEKGNQPELVETEPDPSISVTPKLVGSHNSSMSYQDTPTTCSSNSSCRKLRILIKKPVPRSKINFGQLENVEEEDEEFEDSTYQSDQSVCNDVEEKATESEPMAESELIKPSTEVYQQNLADKTVNPTQITVDQQIDQAAADTKVSEEQPDVKDTKDKLTEQETVDTEQQHNEKNATIKEGKEATGEGQQDIITSNELQQPEEEASQQATSDKQEQQQPDQIAAERTQQPTDEQQLVKDNIDNLCTTETTGVDKEECIDAGSSNQTDASEPDAAKRKQMLQMKQAARGTAMAPPATPKKDLSPAKAARRLGKPIKLSEQPKQKRRKLAESKTQHGGHEDKRSLQLETKELSSTNKAAEEPGGKAKKQISVVKKSVPQESALLVDKFGQTLTSTKLSKKHEANKTPPIKSSLSKLLSGDDSMTVDNTVIITKTEIPSTTQPFKKVDTPASPAGGINISVSLMPDVNNQMTLTPKKLLTQTETAKKLISLSAATQKLEVSPIAIQPSASTTIEKSHTPVAETTKKLKVRKSDADKRARVAGKIPSADTKKKPTATEETNQNLEAKEPAKPAAVVNPIVSRKSSPHTHEKKLSAHNRELSAAPAKTSNDNADSNDASEAMATAKGMHKKDLRKVTGHKSFRKSKSKEVPEVSVAEATAAAAGESRPLATNTPSESRDSSNERKKRSARMTKISQSKAATPVTRACSHARSLADTPSPMTLPTKHRNPSHERQPATLPDLIGQMAPKPQRQSRKSSKLAKTEAHTPPQSQGPASVAESAKVSHSRKRKLPDKPVADGVKRSKEQPATPQAAIAFPVRITAASIGTIPASEKPIADPMATIEIPKAPPPIVAPQQVQKPKDLKLPAQPLPPKMRKLRVRLNRSVITNWLKGLQQPGPSNQRLESSTAPAPSAKTAANAPPKQADATSKLQLVARKQLSKIPIANSVPLPVPLPVLEIKAEQPEVEDEPQSNASAAQTMHMEVDVPAPSITQAAASISSSHSSRVEPTATTQAEPNIANNSNNAVSSSSSTTATTASTTNSNSTIPAARTASDQNTFGTTKMFSFLYPSRYQYSYGHVGLDFCCPNLDGPMQAIDPTRLHSKVEVPVLELPQYMVISTKIISKQDKNIPQKVRAKLEQLAAANDAEPRAIQTMLPPTTTATIATPSVTTSAPATVSNVNSIARQQPPRSTTLAKKPQPTSAAAPVAAAPSPTVASSTATASTPGFLQLPPICPTEKRRVELQTRVQIFDHILQNLARRASLMSVEERQQVIKNIVRTSSLLPIDVDMATQVLENYSYYLYAINNTRLVEQPKLRSIGTSTTSTTPTFTTAVSTATASNTSSATATALPMAAEGSKPIYDKGKNIIGYQYKTPNLSLNSAVVRTPLAISAIRGTSPKGGQPPAAAGLGPTATHLSQQQRMRLLMTANAASGKVSGASPAAEATRVAKRVGSGTMIPFNPSPAQKTYGGRSTSVTSAMKAATAAATNKVTPVGVVSGMPQFGASGKASIASASSQDNSNRSNLFIVNQLLSQQEECILPDAIGTVDAAADIKGELEDAEILT